MGTIDATVPPPAPLDSAHRWIEAHAGWLTVTTALLLVAATVVVVMTENWKWSLGAAAALFLISSTIMFTRPLGRIGCIGCNEHDATPINAIFRFAYVFIFAVLSFGGVALYSPGSFFFSPSVSVPRFEKGAKQAPEWIPTVIAVVPGCDYSSVADTRSTQAAACERAVVPGCDYSSGADRRSTQAAACERAVVPGCDYSSGAELNLKTNTPPGGAANAMTTDSTNATRGTREPNPAIPIGAYCGELPPQWVISIGGSILSCHFDGTCPQRLARPEFEPGIEGKLAAVRTRLKLAQQKFEKLDRQIAGTRRRAAAGYRPSGPTEVDLAMQRNDQKILLKQLSDTETELSGHVDIANEWKNPLWHVDGRPIVGGLVVPVYFVVLAMLGALISMMRKIPEFQQRVEPDYPAEFAKRAEADEGPLPPISRSRARDLVVFQILQVVSAPTIAIVAFSYVRPEELATTALLAFAAGFSSEIFLVAIRAVVDRAIGLGPRPARARAVMELAKKSEERDTALPPRGPESSGGLRAGDNVTLAKPVGIAMPGSKGVVLSVEPGDELIVKLTEDHTGMPVAIRLQAAPSGSFQRTSADKQQPEGPAG